MNKDVSWVPAFREFIKLFDIPSKELVRPGKITLYRAQELFLENITTGLANGTRSFTCLKARQLGISTILMLLDIFWCLINPGTQAAFVADSAENLDIFRETINQLLESLPQGFRVPIKKHNRAELVFKNGSRLQYMSAGKGKGLGVSRALNYLHATEISSWADNGGIDKLRPALSTTNPNRLYIFESTAFGFNLFHSLWEEAVEDTPRQKAFFLGWWGKESYSFAKGTPEYEKWWSSIPMMDDEEAFATAKVKEEFGYEITDEQWAWYRAEAFGCSIQTMREKYPSFPEEAWQATGNPFFNLNRLNNDLLLIGQLKPTFSGYQYKLGDNFLDMQVTESNDLDGLDLRVWEAPRDNGRYAIGVDPSFGRNELADRHVISVWRCYSDKLVQVAEYATSIPDTRQCAWVMCHLAGSYRDCIVNIEISGPGATIFNEMNTLKQLLSWGHLRDLGAKLGVTNALDQARWYLYKRPDSMGSGYSYAWKTNLDNKLAIMNEFRDKYNTEQVIVRSTHLLGEMTTLVQDGDQIEASGRHKDDRVMAAALAIHAWNEWIRVPMMAENRTWARENHRDNEVDNLGGEDRVLRHIVPNFLAMRAQERSEAQLRALLED